MVIIFSNNPPKTKHFWFFSKLLHWIYLKIKPYMFSDDVSRWLSRRVESGSTHQAYFVLVNIQVYFYCNPATHTLGHRCIQLWFLEFSSFDLMLWVFLCFIFLTVKKNFIWSIYLFIFLAAVGLHCRTRACSSCSEQGLLFSAVPRFLIAVASLIREHGRRARSLSSSSTWAH